MRPRKIILLVGTDEDRLGLLAFLLETRGYETLRAQTQAEAVDILRAIQPGRIDAMVTEVQSDSLGPLDGHEMIRRAKRMHAELLTLLIGPHEAYGKDTLADAYVPRGACSPEYLLERLGILCKRKRGPKKRPVQSVRIAELAGVRKDKVA